MADALGDICIQLARTIIPMVVVLGVSGQFNQHHCARVIFLHFCAIVSLTDTLILSTAT